jgi:quercetin dioxygenase-like cupin family protein
VKHHVEGRSIAAARDRVGPEIVRGSRRRAIGVVTISAAVGLAALASAQGPAPSEGFVRIRPDEIKWVDIPGGRGAQFATLLGNPSKPGMYVIRAKFPPHVMDAPHTHPKDRFVTVLQGTWYTGTGPVFDPTKAVPLGPGSVMKHPAGALHWDGSAGEETVVVQIIGEGPGSTTPLDPKAPQWIEARR